MCQAQNMAVVPILVSGTILLRPPEIAIRSRDGWRTAPERFRIHRRDAQEDAQVRKAAEVIKVVVGCAEDMKVLWPFGKTVQCRGCRGGRRFASW